MRLHTGGCRNTVRESALKADSGKKERKKEERKKEKIACRTVDSNLRQYRARLFCRTLYQLVSVVVNQVATVTYTEDR